MEAIDKNRNQVLESNEIAKAAESLRGLDKNGDGQLGHDELVPPTQDQPLGPPPPVPAMEAIDKNRNQVLESDEIAKAAESLRGLDKNGDGELTIEELLPSSEGPR